jgi:arylsulfatase A-like enzyme
MKTNKLFILTGLAAIASTSCSQKENTSGQPAKPMNILYIMTDDHSFQTISAYDKRYIQTPNIDRIANEGVRFTNSFVANSISGPSRACMLTGKHSHKNGFIDNAHTFDGSQQTFPKLLRKAGYQTAMIGKWHLTSDPTGFDYWNILVGQGDYYNPIFIDNGEKRQIEGYATNITTDLALDWLDNKRDKSKPFCLLLHHKAPHRTWMPDTCDLRLYDDVTFPLPENFYDDYAGRIAASEQEMSIIKDMDIVYDLKMADKENEIHSSNADLEKNDLLDNTLIVYTSDQGFYMGEHGWFDKRFMYEESFRTPLLMRLPGGKKGDIPQLVQNIDYAPTFLELAGAPIPADIQGESLLPLLKGERPENWRNSLYYHYYEYPAEHSVKRHYGVRDDRYKLIHFYNDIDVWELYDLQEDPHEMNNLYGKPSYEAVMKRMRDELYKLQKQYDDPVGIRFNVSD